MCLLLYDFDQLQIIFLFDFVLFLYLALPLSLGSMAVTGGLIYNGKALTLKPCSSSYHNDSCKAFIFVIIWFKFNFIPIQEFGNHQSDLVPFQN